MKYPRNASCHCGSGLKYKKCHYFIKDGYSKTAGYYKKGVILPSYDLGQRIGGKHAV